MDNKIIDEKLFKTWVLGMIYQELELPMNDISSIKKVQNCANQIVEFIKKHKPFENGTN